MKCSDFRELISAYLDGTCSIQERAVVVSHIEACQNCKEEMQLMQEMMDFFHEIPMTELPKDFHGDLMQRLAEESKIVPIAAHKPKKSPMKWKQLSLVAAAALLVVASGGIKGILENRESSAELIQSLADEDDVSQADEDEAVPFISRMTSPEGDEGTLDVAQVVSAPSNQGAQGVLVAQPDATDRVPMPHIKTKDINASHSLGVEKQIRAESQAGIDITAEADEVMVATVGPTDNAAGAGDGYRGYRAEHDESLDLDESFAENAMDVAQVSGGGATSHIESFSAQSFRMIPTRNVVVDEAEAVSEDSVVLETADKRVIDGVYAVGGEVLTEINANQLTATIPEESVDELESALDGIATVAVKTVKSDGVTTVSITLVK